MAKTIASVRERAVDVLLELAQVQATVPPDTSAARHLIQAAALVADAIEHLDAAMQPEPEKVASHG